jgi:hypothetical protein
MHDQFSELGLGNAADDALAGFAYAGKDAQRLLVGEGSDSEEEDEMFFSDDVGLSSSPLIRALRGDPHPKAHHHGLHERQIVGAWRTLETPTWINSRQELAAVHKIHKELGLVTIQFILDQRRMMVPQAFVEPVINEPPPVQVRYLPKGAPLPTQEEAMQPWHPYWSHQPQGFQGSQIPGLPTGPYPPAIVERAIPQFAEPERWPVPQNTAQALRNRSIPPQAIKNTYGTHFYSELYKNNFYKFPKKEEEGRQFYVPLSGGAYEQFPNGNLVPVERLRDGRIVPKVRPYDAEDSLFGHMGRHMGVH